ncbi:VOC family protein [Mycetocola reblochoni]|uniref:Glyoxalase-like domain-containing protein n=2 Tax=Mycetocola reblochoni TaxID=331618 RepID=A0A1R4I733_9MICO|nr:VOC family protein [Mycetocola reblochoni]RLP68899.1 VOC family protein [Mycetocola reblochoni]SJN15496.1 hypothetical protein FM119_00090 [Mycetocola reblochoni REB411]
MAAQAVPATLDHLVVAGPSLAELTDHVHRSTGVLAQAGGSHPGGTANRLIALTVDGARRGHYLELIGPDPDGSLAVGDVTTFGIRTLDHPRLAAWAVHPDDIAAASERAFALGHATGPVEALSRHRPDGVLLEWLLTRGGADAPTIPFLIDWGPTPHPSVDTEPELELASIVVSHPEPLWAESVLDALGVHDVTVSPGPAAVRAELVGPAGRVVVS